MSHPNSSVQNPQDKLSEDEQKLKRHLSAHLDTQAESLDFNVSHKLKAARHRAMAGEAASKPGWFGRASWQMVAGGSFAAVLLALVVNQLSIESTSLQDSPVASLETETTAVAATTATLIEDLHLLSATDDIDFYQSVEFLEWMEMNSG